MTDDLRNLSGQQSGQLAKEWVYARDGRRWAYTIPTNPQTTEQQVGRMRFKDLCVEFLDLGPDLRVQLRAALGYRWHSKLIGWALGYGAQKWGILESVYSTFSDESKAAWQSYDRGRMLENEQGLLFFLASSVVYQAVVYYANVEPFDRPGETNSTDIAEGWPRMAYVSGEGVLADAFDITGALNLWVDTGLSVLLPRAGLFRLRAEVRGYLIPGSGNVWWIQAMLRNNTDDVDIAYSERLVVLTSAAGEVFQMTAPLSKNIEVDAQKEIGLYVLRNATGSTPTFTASQILSNAAGRTVLQFESV